MAETQDRIIFHRFRDYVAFHTQDTDTLYVTAKMARKLSEQFIRYADDIENQPKFSESTIGTWTTSEKPENTV